MVYQTYSERCKGRACMQMPHLHIWDMHALERSGVPIQKPRDLMRMEESRFTPEGFLHLYRLRYASDPSHWASW